MNLELFEKFCCEENIKYSLNELMRNHTSFKIGGPADILVTVASVEQLKKIILKANELDVKWFILGKGSNLLVSDDGIEGVVITLAGITDITVNGDEITAGAGVALSELCRASLCNSLSGLEFAYGIPGSVGGGLYMNAGAYGGEMKDVAVSADYIDSDGNVGKITVDEMNLGYRTSIFKTSDKIITSVTVKLVKGDKCEIEAKMNDFINRRRTKQPLEYPSGGSTFKRPTGYYAGALIEKNNLKGKSIGGAMVSEKHAGFIINYNNATCKDVKNLIETVRKAVLQSDGVALEPEIIFTGRQ